MGLFQSKPAPVFPYAISPPPPVQARSGILSTIMILIGVVVLVLLGMSFYNYLRKRSGQQPISLFSSAASSGDKAPVPVDGKTKTVIPAIDVPVGSSMDMGVQFWMYISDWDYKFGQEKAILERVSSTNESIKTPMISLSPNENTLNVRVSLFPSGTEAGVVAPNGDMNATGDSFNCSVENVPLQSWFAVSVTVFQRNLDVYINGKLVKSCVLPGVPKPASGDIVLNNNGGFSGSICNVHSYTNMLTPEDAQAFFAAGTNCAPPVAPQVDKDSVFITLFGYTFRFTTLNQAGKEISSYTF